MSERTNEVKNHLDQHEEGSLVETIFRRFSKMEMDIRELKESNKKDNDSIRNSIEELHQLFTQLNLGDVVTKPQLDSHQREHTMLCKQEILPKYVKKGQDFANEYDELMRARSQYRDDTVTRKNFKEIYEDMIKSKVDNSNKAMDFILKLSQVLTPVMIGVYFLMKAKIGG